MFGRATIRLGIGPHSSLIVICLDIFSSDFTRFYKVVWFRSSTIVSALGAKHVATYGVTISVLVNY